jgi:putative spermidine/putrescine transport system ATP-binding protein
MTGLSISGLTRRYASGAGINSVDLTVAPGELMALVGPSGCGKSTLLRTVAGLGPAYAGQVRVGDRVVTQTPPEQRGIVMIFQQPLLFPHMTAGENAAFSLRLRGASARDARAEALAALHQVQLDGLADRYPDQLSGGQQQRVALARALVARPEVLLLDEPFSALDAPLRAEMRDLLRTLQQKLGLTMLFVTHDQEEAALLGDRIAVMSDGRLLQVGPATELYYRPNSPFVARFIGQSTLVQGRVEAGRFRSPFGSVETEGAPDGPAVGVIRPEQIILGPPLPDRPAAHITDARFAGGVWLITLATEESTLLARQASSAGGLWRPGQIVSVRLQGPVWCIADREERPSAGQTDETRCLRVADNRLRA